MMEFLEFTFRDFWTFIGMIILIYTIGVAGHMITSGLSGIININSDDKENEDEDSFP